MANEGNLSLEQGKPVSHSETSHLVFFALTAHRPGGERQNTMRCDGGNPSMKVKIDSHFFGVQTPRDTGISAKGKTPSFVGTRPVCARGTKNGPILTRRVMSVSDPKLPGMLFFGTHVRRKVWNRQCQQGLQ